MSDDDAMNDDNGFDRCIEILDAVDSFFDEYPLVSTAFLGYIELHKEKYPLSYKKLCEGFNKETAKKKNETEG
jgi:hypothetical protein